MAKRSRSFIHSQSVIAALKDPSDPSEVAKSIPDITSDEEQALFSYCAATALGGVVIHGDNGDPLLPRELIMWMREKNLRTFDEVLDYGEPEAPAPVVPMPPPSFLVRLFAPLIERHRRNKAEKETYDRYFDAMSKSTGIIDRAVRERQEREAIAAEEAAEAALYAPVVQPVYVVVERQSAPYKPGFLASVGAMAAGFWVAHKGNQIIRGE